MPLSSNSDPDFGLDREDDFDVEENNDLELEPEYELADSAASWISIKEKVIFLLQAGLCQFNEGQAKVAAMLSYSLELMERGEPGLKLFIQGKAGVGKSFIIRMISLLIRAIFCHYEFSPVLRCSPTGTL